MEQDSSFFIRRLVENVSDAMIASDPDFSIREWNPQAVALYGFTREEALGHRIVDLTHREYTDCTREDVLAEFQQTGQWQGEVIERTKSGRMIRVYCKVSKIYSQAGDYIGIVSVNRDITDARLREIRRERVYRIYRLIAEAAAACTGRRQLGQCVADGFATVPGIRGAVIVLTADPRTESPRIVCASPGVEDNLVQSLTEDASLNNRLNHRDGTVIVEDTRQTGDGSIRLDVLRDYGYTALLACGIRSPETTAIGTLYLLTDRYMHVCDDDMHHMKNYSHMLASAVHRVTAHEAHKISERKFRTIFENILDVFFRIEPDGTLRMLSPSGFDFIGKTDPTDVIGRSVQELMSIPRENLESFVNKVINEKTVHNYFWEFKDADGSLRQADINARVVPDHNGTPLFIEGIIRDVTDRVKMEAELRQKDRLENMGFLVGSVAHTFNNNLTAVLGNISVAKFHSGEDSRLAGFLDKAEAACLMARQTVQNLMMITGDLRPHQDYIEPETVIRAAVDTIRNRFQVRFVLNIPENLPRIKANEKLLKQVFIHILTNAAEAMDCPFIEESIDAAGAGVSDSDAADGNSADTVQDSGSSRIGTITIDAKVLTPPPDSSEAQVPAIEIRFEDTGPGIAPDARMRVFEPFFTTRSQSRGLGLSVSRSIVRRHDGSITLTSSEDTGTEVLIRLPVETPQTDTLDTREGLRILILEPETGVRTVFVELMKELGHRAEGVGTGRDFLNRFKYNIDKQMPFDVVFIDMGARDSQSGLNLLHLIRKSDSGIRAIATTGYPDHIAANQFEDLGFDGRLLKPFRLDAVEAELNRIL